MTWLVKELLSNLSLSLGRAFLCGSNIISFGKLKI
jgi:hypothetical protein